MAQMAIIHPAPRGNREARPHWLAARAGRLVMPFCQPCDAGNWPPADACPHCGGALTWRDCSGAGKVVSFSVVRRAVQPEWQDLAPYVVAMIELAEGVRLLSNIVDCAPEAVTIGATVMVAFHATTDPELGVPVFLLTKA
jgi:uncharacterized OB-fold protein